MHLKFLSQEELQIAPSPLCPRQICEIIMETENQYRNDHLPIVTSHSSNWTFHWWSNDRTVILASFHRGRGVQIRIICKTIYNIL